MHRALRLSGGASAAALLLFAAGVPALEPIGNAVPRVGPYEFAQPQAPLEFRDAGIARDATLVETATFSPDAVLGQFYESETEPNNTSATATPLPNSNTVVRASVYPEADTDFYAFNAAAGDRVHAAVMTGFSANGSTDSQLRLFATNGTTLIEFDEDDGSLGGFSSSIAGAVIPTPGTYYLEVKHFNAALQLRPYELHLRVQGGAPGPEVEPNDTPATANPLPASGWVSGARSPAAATEQDWYSLSLNAGDTVYLSLDADPERNGISWNGRLGFGLFGDASNQILVVDDANAGTTLGNPASEAMFFTVRSAGTYFAFVDSASAATGGPTATYQLSVSVRPSTDESATCTTYTSADAPQALGPGATTTRSTITVPGNPRIADLDLSVTLNHAVMNQLDMHLRSPAGNDNGVFTDIGAAAAGGQSQMDVTFDDDAASQPAFTVLRGPQYKPEAAYRLSWFDGEDAGGVWTLDLSDDVADANGGTLGSWSLRICEAPPPPVCAPGSVATTVYATDFEAGDAGFTHAGTLDQWARGLPATPATTTNPAVAAFTTCNSGSNCWKTNLTGAYADSSVQDLLSPNIDLAGLAPPVVVRWAQRYQIENATADHAFVDALTVGGGTSVRLWEWQDATMSDSVGGAAANIGASSGWSVLSRRADAFAGANSQLRFHLDSNATVGLGGLAIDDVSVTACRPLSAELAVTVTDGVTNVTAGGSTTYTIVASNAGPDPITATVSDVFPPDLACTWTCTAGSGASCAAAGSGNIADAPLLPAAGVATYTATCAISSSASGTLSNTVTIASLAGDPNAGNNAATDVDLVDPAPDSLFANGFEN